MSIAPTIVEGEGNMKFACERKIYRSHCCILFFHLYLPTFFKSAYEAGIAPVNLEFCKPIVTTIKARLGVWLDTTWFATYVYVE